MCAVACVACDAAFDHWRLLEQVVLPSRHQLAHPFALVVLAITGAHFESSSSTRSSSSNADAVSRVVDASLLAPLLVFASLPATGTQAQQVCTRSACICCLVPYNALAPTFSFVSCVQLCTSALQHMKSIRFVCVYVCARACACARMRACSRVSASVGSSANEVQSGLTCLLLWRRR